MKLSEVGYGESLIHNSKEYVRVFLDPLQRRVLLVDEDDLMLLERESGRLVPFPRNTELSTEATQ